MPITWKNINAPAQSAANQLMMSGGDTIVSGIQTAADALTTEGDRRKGINTDKAIAAMSGIQNLDNFSARRAEIMAGLGNNIDREAIVGAGDSRRTFLQGNQTFENDLVTSKLKQDNLAYDLAETARQNTPEYLKEQADIRSLERQRTQTGINLNNFNLSTARSKEERRQLGIQDDDELKSLSATFMRSDGTLDTEQFGSAAAAMEFDAEKIDAQIAKVENYTGIAGKRKLASENSKTALTAINKELTSYQQIAMKHATDPDKFKAFKMSRIKESIPNYQQRFWDVGTSDEEGLARLTKIISTYSRKVDPENVGDLLSLLGENSKISNDHLDKFENQMSLLRETSSIDDSYLTKSYNKKIEELQKKRTKIATGK